MANPILAALEGMERPPQLLRVDRQIPLDIGEHGQALVTFIVHEKDENGTTLRVEDIQPASAEQTNGSPRAGTNPMIVPSPSA